MDLYRLSVVAHIVLSIMLVGLALFWIIMSGALRRRFDEHETVRLLQVVNRARWPHVAVPYRWRLPLPWLTWLIVLALWGTGVVNWKLRGMPEGVLWWSKFGLFFAIVGVLLPLTRRQAPVLMRLNFVLVIAMVAVSSWVIR